MAKFITLSGKKQVGKDSSAKIIRQYLTSSSFTFALDAEGEINLTSSTGRGLLGEFGHMKVHIVHFADALKKACHVIFGIPLEDMETEEGKQKVTHVKWPIPEHQSIQDRSIVVGYRPYLGATPTSFMTVREVLQFVGTELFRNQMDPDIWVESVFRQPWKEDDVVIIADARFPNEADIAVKHGLLINVERATGLEGDGHKSETALDDYIDYHYSIDNNGSVDDLVHNLCSVLSIQKLSV